MRDRPNIETVAFIAIGADEAMRARKYTYDADCFGGYVGLIGEVCGFALALDRMADEVDESTDRDFVGVFAYDVAERFGNDYALALIDGTGEKPEVIAERIIADAIIDGEQPVAT